MKHFKNNLLLSISLVSITLLSTGCAPKNPDGSYASAYSYHPYLKNKANKRTKQPMMARVSPFLVNLKHSYNLKPTIPTRTPRYKTRPARVQFINQAYSKPIQQLTVPKLFSKNQNNHYHFQPTPTLVNNIEQTAKSLLGVKYQYGANGPYQYDCSSFTQHVFKQQGINLPRVSREQAQTGLFISSNQLQKGDLIFFDSKKSQNVSHVGIYLGNGDFIHASSAKHQVTISNLRSNYYSKHFKWGRRVTQPSYAMR